MRKTITKEQLIISLLIGNYALIEILYFISIEIPSRFIFMTWWNLYLNSFYLISILIFDILFYFKINVLEKINYFFREHLSPILCTLTFLVSLIFWCVIYPMIIFLGKKNPDKWGAYVNFYVHIILTCLHVVDVFYGERKKKFYDQRDWNGVAFIMGIYSIVVLICYFKYNFAIYPFLEKLNGVKIIIFFVGFVFIFTMLYYLYIKLVDLKYKFKMYISNEEDKMKKNE